MSDLKRAITTAVSASTSDNILKPIYIDSIPSQFISYLFYTLLPPETGRSLKKKTLHIYGSGHRRGSGWNLFPMKESLVWGEPGQVQKTVSQNNGSIK